MHWFLDPVQNHYADFSGRATRQQFWMFHLIFLLTYCAIEIIGFIIGFKFLGILFSLALIVPGVAITARRLHDISMSGWWQMIGIIPLVGLFIMLYFLVQDSQPGTNEHGPNPKGVGDQAAVDPTAEQTTAPAAPPAGSANENIGDTE